MPLPTWVNSLCKLCSRFLVGSDEPTIQFLLDQTGLFEQSDHLRPDDLIEQLLSNEAAVVTNRAAEFAPAVGADALVIVDLTCAGLRRGS